MSGRGKARGRPKKKNEDATKSSGTYSKKENERNAKTRGVARVDRLTREKRKKQYLYWERPEDLDVGKEGDSQRRITI